MGYMYLNSMTIKHDYPVPIIDKLSDELYRFTYFSKIDLRSKYFQIRMKASNCYLTTFQTHNGHYEFRVMPFGQCNAPTTFQSLINPSVQTLSQEMCIGFLCYLNL